MNERQVSYQKGGIIPQKYLGESVGIENDMFPVKLVGWEWLNSPSVILAYEPNVGIKAYYNLVEVSPTMLELVGYKPRNLLTTILDFFKGKSAKHKDYEVWEERASTHSKYTFLKPYLEELEHYVSGNKEVSIVLRGVVVGEGIGMNPNNPYQQEVPNIKFTSVMIDNEFVSEEERVTILNTIGFTPIRKLFNRKFRNLSEFNALCTKLFADKTLQGVSVLNGRAVVPNN